MGAGCEAFMVLCLFSLLGFGSIIIGFNYILFKQFAFPKLLNFCRLLPPSENKLAAKRITQYKWSEF